VRDNRRLEAFLSLARYDLECPFDTKGRSRLGRALQVDYPCILPGQDGAEIITVVVQADTTYVQGKEK
jgi:hypothetical protein